MNRLRIAISTTTEQADLLSRAASVTGLKVAAFVLSAAIKEARRVLATETR